MHFLSLACRLRASGSRTKRSPTFRPWTMLAKSDRTQRLRAVGLAASDVELLAVAEGALRTAQSEWTVARTRNKGEAQVARETRGKELRSELIAGVRWNMRKNAKAMATVDLIQDGEGIPDLVQDLVDGAALIDSDLAAFLHDESFDAVAISEAAKTLSEEIRVGLSAERQPADQDEAKELRNRAFTLLDDVLSRVREAGRHAFRKEPQLAARFTSPYLRRRRQRAAKAEAKANQPE